MCLPRIAYPGEGIAMCRSAFVVTQHYEQTVEGLW